ncbi:zfp36l2-A [Symbiodinium natans]|uniref:Zfp36l2-A protein n=1 Tax=Symbiodinium natans TaxID=878477 RepID=A0A812NWV8_9DINO|nr:zfp36l2-A [Symbiodinium natans]
MPSEYTPEVVQSLKNTRMCKFVESGHCRRGQACNFAHSKEDLRPQPNLVSTRLCAQFSAGGCRYGRRCRFAHGQAELRQIPLPEEGRPGRSSTARSGGPQYADLLLPVTAPGYAAVAPGGAFQESPSHIQAILRQYPMPCPSASAKGAYPDSPQGTWGQAGRGMALRGLSDPEVQASWEVQTSLPCSTLASRTNTNQTDAEFNRESTSFWL